MIVIRLSKALLKPSRTPVVVSPPVFIMVYHVWCTMTSAHFPDSMMRMMYCWVWQGGWYVKGGLKKSKLSFKCRKYLF